MSEPPDDPSGDPARYDSRQSYSTKPRIGYYRPMIPNIGPMEIAIVVIIALLVFGPRKLPSLGRSLGQGISEFRSGLSAPETAEAEDPEPAAIAAGRAEGGTSS